MILKLGSKGEHVKTLQEFLGLKADGDFGPKTELAVMNWQTQNGLHMDGIVGPNTWNAMGLATTDSSENVYKTDNGLTVYRHLLPKGEYKEDKTNKEYLFLHHTAGWHNPFNQIDQWARDDRGTIGTEFVLGGPSIKGDDDEHDGTLVQAIPEGGYGWHLGKNGSQHMHTHSVGIEICNFGQLNNGKAWQGTKVVDSQQVKLSDPFRGFDTWHKYSDNQLKTLKKFIEYIADRDNIDITKGIVEEVKKNGVKAFDFNEEAYYGKVKGMWLHVNTRKDKYDLFPQQELIDMFLSL